MIRLQDRNGGNGVDTAVFEGSSITDFVVDLSDTNAQTVTRNGVATDTITSIENITTDRGDDIVTGSFRENIIILGDGNDTADGGPDDDYIEGGKGNDTLTGGTGQDTLIGGEGNDIVYADEDDIEGSGEVSGGEGTDSLFVESFDNITYDFVNSGFESATVSNSVFTYHTFSTAANGDTTQNDFYRFGNVDGHSQRQVRRDVSDSQAYTELTAFYSETNDALDVVIQELDNGNRVTDNYGKLWPYNLHGRRE